MNILKLTTIAFAFSLCWGSVVWASSCGAKTNASIGSNLFFASMVSNDLVGMLHHDEHVYSEEEIHFGDEDHGGLHFGDEDDGGVYFSPVAAGKRICPLEYYETAEGGIPDTVAVYTTIKVCVNAAKDGTGSASGSTYVWYKKNLEEAIKHALSLLAVPLSEVKAICPDSEACTGGKTCKASKATQVDNTSKNVTVSISGSCVVIKLVANKTPFAGVQVTCECK